jgi:hypothetical protein
VPTGPRRFAFRLPALTRLFLLPWGVGIRPAEAVVDDEGVTVRFGFFGTRVAIADIERFEISGPFSWIRAIAVRHTLFKTDFSFCTDARGAVRLYLRSQRPLYWARHVDQVYVGIEDLEGMAEELRRRGIPGEDRRAGAGGAPPKP